MSLFFPKIALNSITEITSDMLEKHDIKGLLIDIDNTLTLHNSQKIEDDVKGWVKEINSKYPIVLLSNNNDARVKPFAEMLGLDYLASAAKPLPSKGLKRATKKLGLKPEQVAIIGDQIFTDIFGGNLLGVLTIRVEPIQTEGGVFFKIKRFFENLVIKRYDRHSEKENI